LTTLSVYTRNVNLFRNNKHPIISLNRFYQNLPRSFQTILFIPAGALISVGAAALAKYIIKSKKE
jgi:hypothetical protein